MELLFLVPSLIAITPLLRDIRERDDEMKLILFVWFCMGGWCNLCVYLKGFV